MKLRKIVLYLLISGLLSCNAFAGLDFDPNKPYDRSTVSSLPGFERETRQDLLDFGLEEHYAAGQHKIPYATTATLGNYSPLLGRVIYNTTTGALLYGNGTAWVGTNGTTTVYYAQISNYSNSLTTAVSTIGATPTTLIIDGSATLSAHTTVPLTLTLEFVGAGKVVLGNFNLTLNCDYRAPPTKIFDYTGSGTVVRGPTGKPFSLMEHFGAAGDGATNDRGALLNAYLYHGSYYGTVILSAGRNYLVSTTETTIPQNVALLFNESSKISLVNSNLILNSYFISPYLQQVFALTGTGLVKRGSTGQSYITPEAFGTGVAAFSAAFSYCTDYAAEVICTQGNYGVTSSLTAVANSTLVVKKNASVVVTSPAELNLLGRVRSEKEGTAWHSGTGSVVISTATFAGLTGDYDLPYGTYFAKLSTTIPDTLHLRVARGAIVSVNDATTLTVNCSFDVGIYQWLNRNTTGSVLFGAKSLDKVYVEWFGYSDTNNQPLIQAAVNSIAGQDAIIPILYTRPEYKVTSPIILYKYAAHKGLGNGTKIVPVGNTSVFTVGEHIDDYYFTIMERITIDSSANDNDIDQIYVHGFNLKNVAFRDVTFKGNPGRAQTAFHSTLTGIVYRLVFEGFTSANFYGAAHFYSEGGALQFDNEDVWRRGTFAGGNCFVDLYGQQAAFQDVMFGPITSPILTTNPVGANGSNVRVRIHVGVATFRDCWFEASGGEVVAEGYSSGGHTSRKRVWNFGSGQGVDNSIQVIDVSADTTQLASTYVSPNSCTVVGDLTSKFPVGMVVWAKMPTHGKKHSAVASATYVAPNTTIVFDDNMLTEASVEYLNGCPPQARVPIEADSYRIFSNFKVGTYKGADNPAILAMSTYENLTVTFDSADPILAGDYKYYTVTVAGAAQRQVPILIPNSDFATGIEMVDYRLSNTDTLKVRFKNTTAANYPAAGTVAVTFNMFYIKADF